MQMVNLITSDSSETVSVEIWDKSGIFDIWIRGFGQQVHSFWSEDWIWRYPLSKKYLDSSHASTLKISEWKEPNIELATISLDGILKYFS